MSRTESRHARIVRFIAPAVPGVAVALLAFSGVLFGAEGPLFDALGGLRPAPEPASRIVLLEADAAALAEAGRLPWNRDVLADGLALLIEMEAASVVYDEAIENETVRRRGAGDELTAAFDREFGVIENNVRTLFEGIRLGSVRPADAGRFVEGVVALAEAGKARLLDAAGNRERDRQLRFDRYAAVLGGVRRAEAPLESGNDLVRKTFARIGLSESQDPLGYALLDAALERLGNPRAERTKEGLLLRGARTPGFEPRDIELPLDRTGALILELPSGMGRSDFKRVSYELLLRHGRLEKALVAELAAMERAGYLAEAGKDLSPAAVYAYAEQTGVEATGEWRALRRRFYESASKALSGETEGRILNGYDALLASPTLTAEGRASLSALKSAAANTFRRSRETLAELAALRISLKKDLSDAICATVPALRAPVSRVKAAAALADAVLSERFVRELPAATAFAAAAAFAVLLGAALAFLGPAAAIPAGIAAGAAAAAGAGLLFTLGGRWIDPLLFAGTAAAVTAASAFLGFVERGERKRAMLRAFAPRLSPEALKRLSRSSSARLLEGEKREASVVAVRAKGISEYPESADSRAIVSAFRIYHETIGGILKERGAFLYAIEGELIFASFGAPVAQAGHRQAAAEAALAVVRAEEELDAAFAEEGIAARRGMIRVGVDSGLCDFGEAGLAGFSAYAAFGPVPVRARVLSNLCERYGCRVLATEELRRGLDGGVEALRLDRLVTKADGREDFFYELRDGSADEAAEA